jgi:hypothetical protein
MKSKRRLIMRKFRFTSGLSIGLIAGILLTVGTSSFAEDGLQKIDAYLRPDLPITLNGQSIKLESSPVMVDGNTYLKLRDISKLTGIGVNWNENSQTVELATYGSNLPTNTPPITVVTPEPTPTPFVKPTPTVTPVIIKDKETKVLNFGETYDSGHAQVTLYGIEHRRVDEMVSMMHPEYSSDFHFNIKIKLDSSTKLSGSLYTIVYVTESGKLIDTTTSGKIDYGEESNLYFDPYIKNNDNIKKIKIINENLGINIEFLVDGT